MGNTVDDRATEHRARVSRRSVLTAGVLGVAGLAAATHTSAHTSYPTNRSMQEDTMSTTMSTPAPNSPAPTSQPTVVLVHGAFAESGSWNGVIRLLQGQGYTAVAAANPLRSIAGDSAFVSSIVSSVKGPVILVGHSYGGAIITGAAAGNDNVKALVFVSAFAPEEGEQLADLTGKFPGSTLTGTLASVPLSDGSNDLYIRQDAYYQQFEADVPAAQAALDAATQRPIRDFAFTEPTGPATWKTIPSWFAFADQDKNIPVAVHRYMAQRANAREAVEVKGGSHSFAVVQPGIVANLIFKAAAYIAQPR